MLINEHADVFLSNGIGYRVKLKDITPESVYVENLLLNSSQTGAIKFTLPGDLGTLTVNFKVKRCDWAKLKGKPTGSVLIFNEVSVNIQELLKTYVIYLKNQQIIQVSRRIMQEFFGKRPTK